MAKSPEDGRMRGTMEKKERDSGIELLRIIGLLLIFWMHGASSYRNNELSAWLCVVIETIGNVGVPIFILVSGYFGIRLKPKKMIQLDLMLIFYCWIGLFLRFLWGEAGAYSGEEILSYVFPVIGRNSWYFTCYFALAFLSPFLNEFVESLSRERFQKLLLTMLIIFSGITTVCFFDITQDGGKGIVNMTMLYLIGRYIRLHEDERTGNRRKLAAAYLAISLVCIALNGALYGVTHTMQNRFARDNTLFTIGAAICIFLLFKEIHFNSKVVNAIASHVPAVFTMEWTLRGIITAYMFPYLAWNESNWHEWILLGVSVLLIAMGTVIDSVRVLLFGKAEEKLAGILEGCFRKLGSLSKKLLEKALL